MKPFTEKDKKIIALLTILAGILAAACLWVGAEAVQFDFEAFSNPARILGMQHINLTQIRWFMLLDTLGYYLLLLPILFYLHSKLVLITPWSNFITSCGFIYILVGAIGATSLAVVWPSLIEDYSSATPEVQQHLKSDFLVFTDFVVKGLWNHLEVLPGGIWWVMTGFVIVRQKWLKVVTLVTGFSALLDGTGEWLQSTLLAETGLNLYLLMGIIWPVCIGITLLKNKSEI